MVEPIKIALLGLGTVGGGVAEILERHGPALARRAGAPLELAGVVVRDPQKRRDAPVSSELLRTSPGDLLARPDVPIVVETVGCPDGSLEPARAWILEALRHGKHVVTANKDLVAQDGEALLAAAREGGGSLRFEAAVAGGIPIIKAMQESLAANRIEAVMGIINGTTNYMLTRMSQENAAFDAVLQEAQRLGYAEADPTSDIEGYDAAYKLRILASLAFETHIPEEGVHCEGITRITPEDIAFGRELGYTVKLLAIAKDDGQAIEARVHPTFIPTSHPLAAVNDVFNAIFVRGDAVGELMFYGQGAGKLPTGSAVVADIVSAARDVRRSINGMAMPSFGDRRLRSIEDVSTRYYIHAKVVDRPGVLAAITAAFGDEQVSIESVIQKGKSEDPVSLVFVTHEVREKNVRNALERIERLPMVRRLANVIRVEDL